MITWVTPSLMVSSADGVADDGSHHGHHVEAEAAVKLIRKYHSTAVVSSFATARLVLIEMGLSADEVEDRIHFALTGEVLV